MLLYCYYILKFEFVASVEQILYFSPYCKLADKYVKNVINAAAIK